MAVAVFVAGLAVVVATPEPAHATAIGVNTTSDELNGDGDCSLREAIRAANTDSAVSGCPAGSGADTITLPAGTYRLTVSESDGDNGDDEDAALTGDLDVTSEIDIVGAGSGVTFVETDFSDGNANRSFHVLGGGDLGLSDLTVRGSGLVGDGGGILNAGTLTVTGSTISGNGVLGNGGGISNTGTLTVTGSTISGNFALDTGSGVVGDGGGIFNAGTMMVTRSTVSTNSARIDGGGLAGSASSTISNSTISGNTADSDGNGSGSGGGISGASDTLVNVTVTNNSGGGAGGVAGVDGGPGAITLQNTLVAGNTSGAECANVTTDANNLFETGGDGCAVGASDVTTADPMLGALADNGGGTRTHALQAGSPAIDAGDDTTCAAAPVGGVDQRSVARPIDGDGDAVAVCDIGAFEAPSYPSLSVGDVTVGEGAGPASFTVSINQTSSDDVSVDYATAGGSAVSGVDFTAASGTATIPAGDTSTTVDVAVVDDSLDEADESFTLDLSDPVNAGIGDGSGTGTIIDDDPEPAVSVGDVSVGEGAGPATFTISIDAVSGREVSVDYATAGGSATSGVDFTAASGTATIPAGDASTTVDVAVVDDALDEADESFTLDLSDPVNAGIGDGSGTATIIDDDPPDDGDDDDGGRAGDEGGDEGVPDDDGTGPPPVGVTVAYDSGGVSVFGEGTFFGSIPGLRMTGAPIPEDLRFVDVVVTPDGYYLLDEFGGVHTFGPVPYLGSIPAIQAADLFALGVSRIPLDLRVAAMAVTPDGYYVLDEFGGVHTFGPVPYHGSVPGLRLGGAPIPDGLRFAALEPGPGGSYLALDRSGGVFVFGPGPFPGSIPGEQAAGRIAVPDGLDFVDFAVSPDGLSAWVLDEFGGVWTLGGARFFGSIFTILGRGLPAAGIDLQFG